jgi:hypothetical protein
MEDWQTWVIGVTSLFLVAAIFAWGDHTRW